MVKLLTDSELKINQLVATFFVLFLPRIDFLLFD
jgi:hypothetical protein